MEIACSRLHWGGSNVVVPKTPREQERLPDWHDIGKCSIISLYSGYPMKNKPSLRWLVVILLATSLLQAQPPQKWITLYTDNFSGNHYDFGVGRYDNEYLSLSGISMVHSVRVPAGMKVTLYAEDAFRGNSLTLTKDADKAFLTEKGFADLRLSISIIVEEARDLPADSKLPVVVVYKDDFTGPALRLSTGRYDMKDLEAVGNDHISSVRVPKGLRVTLYEHQNFTGRSLTLTADAAATFLVKNKFNDVTTSLTVEAIPVTLPADSVAVPRPNPLPANPPAPTEAPTAAEGERPGVIIFQGDFSGTSQQFLQPGTYSIKDLNIGNNEVSSVKVPEGYRVTLYDGEAFSGRSLVLEETHATTAFLESKKFNNITSSLEVARVQRAQLFEDAFTGSFSRLSPGLYDLSSMGIRNDQLSAVQIPEGWWVLLFEHEGFRGQSLLLTRDTDPTYLRNRGFDNQTSSLVIGDARAPLPQVIVYADNLSGTSQNLTPGAYEHPDLEVGNNTISSVSVPRGLRVTLFENSDFTGRTLVTTKTVDSEFLVAHQFNDITSAVQVQWRRPEEMMATIFSDRFEGRSQKLEPGRYEASQLTIGQKALSSLRVPKGLRVTLFETDNLAGINTTIERDTDFTGKRMLDNTFASLIVEDISEPIVSAPPAPAAQVIVDTVTSVPPAEENVAIAPDCSLTEREYTLAVEAINGKAFSQEKLDMARIATKEKCMTNTQIAGIARLFNYEEQTLEFVKESYERASEKSTYYTLQEIFNFMSTRDAFLRFLKEQQ